jgi:hypothetical protein
MFNFQTPVLNVRIIPVTFFIFIGWGFSGWHAGAWNLYKQHDGYEY